MEKGLVRCINFLQKHSLDIGLIVQIANWMHKNHSSRDRYDAWHLTKGKIRYSGLLWRVLNLAEVSLKKKIKSGHLNA